MEHLGRFYTENVVSNLLISSFKQKYPQNILDLGAGAGSLLKAAHRRWGFANFHAIDIDQKSINEISRSMPFVNLHHINGLTAKLPDQLNLKVGSIDIAICNPPYLKIKSSPEIQFLCKNAGLEKSAHLKKITSDIVFLAQNLQFLKNGGELGIILPDNIFNCYHFENLRYDFIFSHKILGVIQLPDKIFPKTEARTHILLIEKNGKTEDKIPVFCADINGKIIGSEEISKTEAINRMDFSYYSWKNRQKNSTNQRSLAELGVEIKRGSRSKKYLEQLGIKVFHTSSFPKDQSNCIDLADEPFQKLICAEEGDILLARVGKRCVGRVTLVRSGKQVISDCVLSLRVSKRFREVVWRELISENGQKWFKASSHGVCSRVISKKDLLKFKVIIPNEIRN